MSRRDQGRRDQGHSRPRPSIRSEYDRSDHDHATAGHDRQRGSDPTLPRRPATGWLSRSVPLRLFLGGTFVYAGLDKIIDPTFLRSAGPGSIAAQLEAFTRISPIGFIVHLFGQPFPVPIGWLIALAEIAIGLGALLGIALRSAALGGAALSFLFWLTASWATRPYYYGPDLPYAFAWLTLAFVGHGGRFALEGYVRAPADHWADAEPGAAIDRRLFLQASVLGAGAMALAALGGTLGARLFRPVGGGVAAGQTAVPSDGTLPPIAGASVTPLPSASASAGQSAAPPPPTGTVIGRVARMTSHRPITFVDPQTGDPGIVIKLANGSIVAYDTTCTHAGCTVEFDPSSSLLICPCHGATFDPSHDAEVLGGPTDQPLLRLPIKVDAASGNVYLQG